MVVSWKMVLFIVTVAVNGHTGQVLKHEQKQIMEPNYPTREACERIGDQIVARSRGFTVRYECWELVEEGV